MLANRQKLVLNSIVSYSQSVFIPSKLIIDNVLIAYEMTDFLQNKRARKARYMSIKLDISKAYDRLDWDYFEAITINLWFNQRWIKLMMFYVRSVSFSIMIKEDPIG